MFKESEQNLWDTYKLLRESVTYQVPHTPKALMSDFYMLAYLDTIPFDSLVNQGTTNALRFDDGYKHDLNHAQSVLYPFLKEHLLNALFFAMCSEMKYAFNARLQKDFLQKNMTFIQSYHKYLKHYSSEFGSIDPRMPKNPSHADDNESYQQAYAAVLQAVKHANIDGLQAVSVFKQAFLQPGWHGSYGGKPWANIAQAWLDLYNIPDNKFNRLAVLIDHIYDLQHNTDTVFNKLKLYYDNGYKWLAEMLDFKANLKDIHALLPFCSSLMQKLARPLLHIAGVEKKKKSTELTDTGSGESHLLKLFAHEAGVVCDMVIDAVADGDTLEDLDRIVAFANEYPNVTAKNPIMTYAVDMISDMLVNTDMPNLGIIGKAIGVNAKTADIKTWTLAVKGFLHRHFKEIIELMAGMLMKQKDNLFANEYIADALKETKLFSGAGSTDISTKYVGTMASLPKNIVSKLLAGVEQYSSVTIEQTNENPGEDIEAEKRIKDFIINYPNVTIDHPYVQFILDILCDMLLDGTAKFDILGASGKTHKYDGQTWRKIILGIGTEVVDAVAIGLKPYIAAFIQLHDNSIPHNLAFDKIGKKDELTTDDDAEKNKLAQQLAKAVAEQATNIAKYYIQAPGMQPHKTAIKKMLAGDPHDLVVMAVDSVIHMFEANPLMAADFLGHNPKLDLFVDGMKGVEHDLGIWQVLIIRIAKEMPGVFTTAALQGIAPLMAKIKKTKPYTVKTKGISEYDAMSVLLGGTRQAISVCAADIIKEFITAAHMNSFNQDQLHYVEAVKDASNGDMDGLMKLVIKDATGLLHNAPEVVNTMFNANVFSFVVPDMNKSEAEYSQEQWYEFFAQMRKYNYPAMRNELKHALDNYCNALKAAIKKLQP